MRSFMTLVRFKNDVSISISIVMFYLNQWSNGIMEDTGKNLTSCSPSLTTPNSQARFQPSIITLKNYIYLQINTLLHCLYRTHV